MYLQQTVIPIYRLSEIRRPNALEIVLVEDNLDMLNSLQEAIVEFGYNVRPFHKPTQALTYIQSHVNSVALLLSDYRMPEMFGDDLIRHARKEDSYLPAILFTGYNQAEVGKRGIREGGLDVLTKPIRFSLLEEKLNLILKTQYMLPTDLAEKKFIVLKIGGSVMEADLDNEYKGIVNIVRVTEELQQEGYQIVVTVGADPHGTIPKSRLAKYGEKSTQIKKQYHRHMCEALRLNREFIEAIYEHDAFVFDPSSLSDLESLDDVIRDNRVIICSTAPRHLTLSKESSPTELLSDSDYQTLKLAQFFGQSTIVIAKDTPGIFSRDPLKGMSDGSEAWRKAQRSNVLHELVYVSEFLDGSVSRKGMDGKDNHLWENSALRAMLGTKMQVAVVCPEYSRFVPGGHSVLPEVKEAHMSDRTILKQSILNAVQRRKTTGVIVSRIVPDELKKDSLHDQTY